MSKRPTLAEQLAEISKPAPVELDPEDGYTTYASERNTDKKDLDAARAEYVDVGASKLRKKGEAVYDAKYAGKKGNRNNLYDEGDSEDDSDGSEDAGDFEDLEGEPEGGDDNDDLEAMIEEEEEGEFGPEDDDDEDSSEEDGEDDDESEEDEEEAPKPAAKPKKSSKSAGKSRAPATEEEEEKAMMAQLQQAASADVEKGRDVKKQLAFCDNLLEARIKIQKAAISINCLPQPTNASKYFSLLSTELESTLAEVESLNEELFAFRKDLLKSEVGVELPSGLGSSRKRKRGPDAVPAEYLKASLADLASLETALTPFLRSTITKWSSKVLAASGLAIGSSKKFKAVNQNAMDQIDHSLAASERERLVKRTRVRRGDAEKSVVGKVDERLEGEKQKGEVDGECFDDGDFYQQVLRDLVESRMLDLDDPTLASLRLASARGKKTKKVVDTRASKGRKIRYHVHEKIQNFMIPIEAAGWHEEQIDELFSSLLGRSFPKAVEEDEGDKMDVTDAPEGAKVEVGSLRIFG